MLASLSDTIIYVHNGTFNEPHADGVTHLLRIPQTLVDYQDKCGVILVQVGLPERTLTIEWLKGDRRDWHVHGVMFCGVITLRNVLDRLEFLEPTLTFSLSDYHKHRLD